jgi:N6-adenosine-specific RNA methylase IME4
VSVYSTRPTSEIKADVPPAAGNAVLFLWAVVALLPDALEVIEAWGFTFKAGMVWVKPSIGLGGLVRYRHEELLIATRGRLTGPAPGARPDSVIEAKRGRHSEKPSCVYELIERMYPHTRKLELYARGAPHKGWHAWGNEVLQPTAKSSTRKTRPKIGGRRR